MNPNTDPTQTLEDIVEQFTAEVRSGQTPDIQHYVQRHPEHADELSDLLSSVAIIEGLKNYSPNSTVPDQRIADIEVPDFLGEYRIVGEIGRGGMGIVFEAVHETLGRRVAIKVMTVGSISDTKHLKRFHREAVSAASLHHTNIANVFGAGQDAGLHFYVMEFIDGQPLSKILKNAVAGMDETIYFPDGTDSESIEVQPTIKSTCSGDPITVGDQTIDHKNRYKWVADTGQQIADALAYAHEKSILHRDIKPANLVLDNHGTVWLTDFGLAKNVTNDALTKTGDIIGTPQYMAPESFSGNYDARSETYCLGLTLYEMATLNPAFENTSPGQIIRTITTSSPPPPHKIDAMIPGDLATIIAKAISREPEHRYQSASELRDDLRAFLEDRPIAARTMSTWEHLVRFSRRNPLAAGLAAFSVLVLCLLAATAATGYVVTNAALQRAQSNVDIALEAFDQTFRQYIAQDLSQNVATATINGQSTNARDHQTDYAAAIASDVYGFEQMGGIEKAITKEDAMFVEKMLGYYQRLAIDNQHSVEVRTQSATANRLVANVYRLIGQSETSLTFYQQALAQFQSLAEEQPDSTDAEVRLVSTRNEMASLMGSTGQWKTGMEMLLTSKRHLEQHPQFSSPTLSLLWVQTINQITSGQVKMIFNDTPPQSPTDITPGIENIDLTSFGISGNSIPESLEQIFEQIKTLGQKAVEKIDELKSANPQSQRVRVTRAESYCNLALQESRAGESQSPNTLQVAIDELENLRAQSPTNPKYQYLLALTHAIASKDQTNDTALDSLDKAKALITDLSLRFPKMLVYRQLYGSVCIELGSLHIQLEDLPAARISLQQASELLLRLKSEMPGDWSAKVNGARLVQSMETLAGQYAVAGNVGDAVEIGLQINFISRSLRLNE